MESAIKFLGVLILVIILSLLMACPTMVLWNWLMTDIFNLKEITFWQALGLNVLSHILLKSSDNSSKD